METERGAEIRRIVERAIELDSDARETFVAAECGEDAQLASEVQDLLLHLTRDDGEASGDRVFRLARALGERLARARTDDGDDGAPPDPSLPPILEELARHLPAYERYELLAEIGRGGGGVVRRCQDGTLERPVAMKTLGDRSAATSAGSPRVGSVARFLQEARITAQLAHPGIVPVHEIGIDPAGRPYFTMALVEGEDLEQTIVASGRGRDGWSQARVLGEILKACQAIAYAHENGVIHRDLKPTNIRIGSFGAVYVMDWGIAKRLDDPEPRPDADTGHAGTAVDAADEPPVTKAGSTVGTPAYMAPERIAGGVSTPETDVYSMGAILYQLLTGSAPYVDQLGATRTTRRILELAKEGAPTPIEERAPSQPGEIVAIAEKALARDPAARYGTMQGLADDLRAYLEGRVVPAYERGAVAELRKWVGRNKPLAFTVSGAAALLLLASLTFSFVLSRRAEALTEAIVRAENSEKEAQLAASEAADQAVAARLEAATSERVVDFVEGMFRQQEADRARGESVTVKEVLDSGAERIQNELTNEPLFRARMLYAMGQLYESLGLFTESRSTYEQALELRTAHFGETHLGTLEIANSLGLVAFYLDDYDEAEELLHRILETPEADDPDIETIHDYARSNLCLVYLETGRLDEAEPLALKSVERRRRVYGRRDERTLRATNNLAGLYRRRRDYERAEELYLECIETARATLGDEHPLVPTLLSNLGMTYTPQERFEEAERLFVEALEVSRRVLGEEHGDTLINANNLGMLYVQMRRGLEAEAVLLPACRAAVNALGREHSETLFLQVHLGLALNHQGRSEEAETLLLQTLDISREAHGELARSTILAEGALGNVYWHLHVDEMAERYTRVAWEKNRRLLGGDHPNTLRLVAALGQILVEADRLEEAERLFLEVLHEEDDLTVDESSEVHAGLALVELYAKQGRRDDAAFWLDRLIEGTPPTHEQMEVWLSMRDAYGLGK